MVDAHTQEKASSGVDTLMGLKIALIFILFFVCYLGLIPAYSKNCRGSQKTLSLMNCFAGGVFLAMAFMHILPESVEQYYTIMSEEETQDARKLRFLQILAANNSTTGVATI
jgi:zinc transporter ZupT